MNSATALQALEKLTGEGPLISDPYFDGGGMHQIERGGRLAVHADFTRPKHLPIFRRLNLLLYLNKEWDASFGGCLELWSCDCKKKVREVAPVANRVVIFTTATTSYHGHPAPLTCPPDRARRSLALYYYSIEPPKRDHGDNDALENGHWSAKWRAAASRSVPLARISQAWEYSFAMGVT